MSGCGDRQTTTTANTSPSPSPTLPTPGPTTPSEAELSGETLAWAEGKTSLILPTGWKEEKSLHDEAQLQAFNPDTDTYIIVLSEKKTDLPSDMTLEQHSEITRGILKGNLTKPEETGPTPVRRVGEYSALQYKIRGTIAEIEVTYLHTTVETEQYFNQILTWTRPETFDQRETELQQIISSFREGDDTP